VDIIFKGRHTDVLERFRRHAAAKLSKIERLSARAIRVDVEVSAERNPRQSGRKERVELTITSPGPAIRAEAAAEDRFAALDMALAKLESRLRRANDRRKGRHGAHAAVRVTDLPEADGGPQTGAAAGTGARGVSDDEDEVPAQQAAGQSQAASGDVVSIEMEGDGPLVVREKFHQASPMGIDQALLEMELVGHDFFLFRDAQCGIPSVVYRRRGYQYGVLRLMEDSPDSRPTRTPAAVPQHGEAGNGQRRTTAALGAGRAG
jgi:ribosomal subunit interface protein